MAIDSLASIALDRRLAQGGRAPEIVDARSASGKSLPHAGTPAPQPPQADAPAVDLSRAISSINSFLQDNQRGFRFQVDKASGRTIVTVVNPVNGEVVRQIPSQEVLDIARALRASGSLLNASA
jgi:uncharacterized FlaG/YvyC family protein